MLLSGILRIWTIHKSFPTDSAHAKHLEMSRTADSTLTCRNLCSSLDLECLESSCALSKHGFKFKRHFKSESICSFNASSSISNALFRNQIPVQQNSQEDLVQTQFLSVQNGSDICRSMFLFPVLGKALAKGSWMSHCHSTKPARHASQQEGAGHRSC
jgi:hypothetical protein